MDARLLIPLLLVLLFGCGSTQDQQSDCESLPPAEKEQCMEELYQAMEQFKKKKRKDSVENPRY